MEVLASRGGRFPFGPSFASLSACSFPFTLTWPGTQWMQVLIPQEDRISEFLWTFRMYSWPGRGCLSLIRGTADWLSQKIQMSVRFSSNYSFVVSSVPFIIHES